MHNNKIQFELVNNSYATIYFSLINEGNIPMGKYFHSDCPTKVKLLELRPEEYATDAGDIYDLDVPFLNTDKPTTLVIGSRKHPLFVNTYKFSPKKRILLEYTDRGLSVQGGTWWSGLLATNTGELRLDCCWVLPKPKISRYDGPDSVTDEEDEFLGDDSMALIPFTDMDDPTNYSWLSRLLQWLRPSWSLPSWY